MVSRGWPANTCPRPPAPPARNSLVEGMGKEKSGMEAAALLLLLFLEELNLLDSGWSCSIVFMQGVFSGRICGLEAAQVHQSDRDCKLRRQFFIFTQSDY